MSNRVTMGQDDSMMLQRDTLPMQVLNKLMDWIMDGKLKMGAWSQSYANQRGFEESGKNGTG